MSRKIPNALLLLALLAYLFHWIGIRFGGSRLVLQATPLHYLLLALLLVANSLKDPKRLFWLVGVGVFSFVVLWLGSSVFGGFVFGAAAGPQIAGIPVVAGLYGMLAGAGICAVLALSRLPVWQKIFGAALLTLFFAWLLAPVAVRLGYWQWTGGRAPLGFYIGSALLGAALAGSWFALRLRPSHLAVALLLLEIVFLALVRL